MTAITLQQNMEHTDLSYLGGYYRCYLDEPVHMEFASEHFCRLLGYTKDELEDLVEGVYTCLMHPGDIKRFGEYVSGFIGVEKCDSIMYRLIRKDGSTILVAETMSTTMCDDGHIRGHAVVCEIDEMLKRTSESAIMGSGNDQFAMFKINDGLKAHINSPSEYAINLFEVDAQAQGYSFLDFVPINDRSIVTDAIQDAFENGFSERHQCNIVSASGNMNKIVFWVERITRCKKIGDCHFCIFIELGGIEEIDSNESQLLQTLTLANFSEDVYEVIPSSNCIKCVSRAERPSMNIPVNIRMFLDDAIEAFLGIVDPDDRDAFNEFMTDVFSAGYAIDMDNLPRIKFRLKEESGIFLPVVATVVPISPKRFYLCIDANTASDDGLD